MVKRILLKYKYPPDQQDAAVELVLQQMRSLGEEWTLINQFADIQDIPCFSTSQ